MPWRILLTRKLPSATYAVVALTEPAKQRGLRGFLTVQMIPRKTRATLASPGLGLGYMLVLDTAVRLENRGVAQYQVDRFCERESVR